MWWKSKVNHETEIQDLSERLTSLEAENRELPLLRDEVERLRHKVLLAEVDTQSLVGRILNLEAGHYELTNDVIERFREERDHHGHLAHPCFSDLQGLMGELLSARHCTGMESAYKKAMEINLNEL